MCPSPNFLPDLYSFVLSYCVCQAALSAKESVIHDCFYCFCCRFCGSKKNQGTVDALQNSIILTHWGLKAREINCTWEECEKSYGRCRSQEFPNVYLSEGSYQPCYTPQKVCIYRIDYRHVVSLRAQPPSFSGAYTLGRLSHRHLTNVTKCWKRLSCPTMENECCKTMLCKSAESGHGAEWSIPKGLLSRQSIFWKVDELFRCDQGLYIYGKIVVTSGGALMTSRHTLVPESWGKSCKRNLKLFFCSEGRCHSISACRR